MAAKDSAPSIVGKNLFEACERVIAGLPIGNGDVGIEIVRYGVGVARGRGVIEAVLGEDGWCGDGRGFRVSTGGWMWPCERR